MFSADVANTITHEEVVTAMYGYLEANGLPGTLKVLQHESQIPYNVVRVTEGQTCPLEAAIKAGKWGEVLSLTDGMLLPVAVVRSLYELMVDEVAELHANGPAARSILSSSPVLSKMKAEEPLRYSRLENLVEAAMNATQRAGKARAAEEKEQARRQQVWEDIAHHLSFRPPILSHKVLPYDTLVRVAHEAYADAGVQATSQLRKRPREGEFPNPAEQTPTTPRRQVPSSDTCPEEVKFRLSFPDKLITVSFVTDDIIVAGCANGSLTLWSAADGSARTKSVMGHTAAVLSLSTSRGVFVEGQPVWMCAGFRDGMIKVYDVESCKLMRKFADAHVSGVTSVSFVPSGQGDALSSSVLSSSFDGTVRLQILKERNATTIVRPAGGAYVHCAASLCQSFFVTGAADGKLKVFTREGVEKSSLLILPEREEGTPSKSLYAQKEQSPLAVLACPGEASAGCYLVVCASRSGGALLCTVNEADGSATFLRHLAVSAAEPMCDLASIRGATHPSIYALTQGGSLLRFVFAGKDVLVKEGAEWPADGVLQFGLTFGQEGGALCCSQGGAVAVAQRQSSELLLLGSAQ